MIIRLMNHSSKKFIEIDTLKARMARKRKKISFWARFQNTKNKRVIMVTLTYKTADQWQANHIRDYIKKTKERLGRGLISYAWVMELQKRGVPHYHILFVLQPYKRIRMPDKAGDWPYGASNVMVGVKTLYYIVSYLKKDCEVTKDYPKGGRVFSVWVSDKELKEQVRQIMIPTWIVDYIRDLVKYDLSMVKRKKDGWHIGEYRIFSGWKLLEIIR